MTEQLLHDTEIGAPLKQVGGKGVAKDMGADPCRIDPRPGAQLFE